jgi:hypothetical protein
MNVGFYVLAVMAIVLLAGFVASWRWRKATSSRVQRGDANSPCPDVKQAFAALANEQKWLLARLVDEGTLPTADWNSCLEAVVFVQRDETTGKRSIKPEYRDDLTRIVKERQPPVRGPRPETAFPRGEEGLRSPTGALG